MVMFGVAAGVSAQEVGKIWIGGSIAAYSAENKYGGAKSSGFNFNLMPEIGYTMTENIGLGINLGYGQEKIQTATSADGILGVGGETNLQKFTIAPFVRYTYLKSDMVGLFVDGTIGYTYGKDKDSDEKLNQYEIGFRPGVALNVSNKVAFTAKFGFLGYQHSKFDDGSGDEKNNKYGLDLDLSNVRLGVNVFF